MTAVPVFAFSKAKQAHYQLRQNGEVPSALLPSPVGRSWERCSSLGLPATGGEFKPCQQAELREQLEKSATLIDHAVPVMEMLHQQIIGSHSMVVLTNAEGFILNSFGDDGFLQRASRVALTPGISWSEETKGTNAIGTALVEEKPIVIHGHHHYFSSNHFLTCSASPIQDPNGKIIGVLDVSGDHRSYSPHTLGLVKMSVRLIENQMFVHGFPDALVVHFHARPEYLGTICEGMIAFSPDGQTLAANQNALTQLGLRHRDIQGSSFEQIFNQSVRTALDYSAQSNKLPLQLTNTRGARLFCRVIAGPSMKAPLRVFTFPRAEESAPTIRPQTDRCKIATTRGNALENLNTGDPQVDAVIQKVRRVIGRDIPILIHGDTGVGKELLAKAIHDDGPRHDMPFIAVNCAAIPESLIESELFGYEEGAFTGAKKRGSCGKVLQADGGTLFLDEIGDMPHPLQARLLRVLQERLVNPLGSTKSIPVDIHLVCATHRKLKDWVAAGKFREDLYYRLNGLTVNLPALRARNDLPALVALILSRFGHSGPNGQRHTVSPAVMEMFLRHPWPGNIRQLSNLLRTASVMAGDDVEIGLDHLPDDFLEEFDAIPTGVITQTATSVEAPPATTGTSPVAEQNLASVLLSTSQNLESTTLGLIQRTLELHQGNVSAAARQLGVSRNTLYRKLRQIWQV